MRILLEFARTQPWHSLLMLACLLVAAAAEALAITSLLPLISALSSPEAGSGLPSGSSDLEGWFARAVRSVGLEPSLEVLLVLVPTAFAVRAVLVLLARREVGYTVARAVRKLRLRLIRALLGSSWSYFVTHRIGTFANAYAVEPTSATHGFFHATWVAMLGLQLIVYVGVAFLISWRMTLVIAGIGLFVVLVLGPLVGLGRRAGLKQTQLSKDIVGTLTDIFQGVKPLKAMAREDRVAPLLEKGTRRMERALRRQVLSREAITALQEPIMVAMLCVGIFAMKWMGMDLSSISVMLLSINRTLDTLNRAQRRYQRVAEHESAYWSLMETIERAEAAQERPAGGLSPTLERGIELSNVCFRHGEESIFEDVSIEIPAGRITALIGPSGSGKTSIVDLVVGLAHPNAGDVLIDGKSLADIDLASWRRSVGYVPQEMFLLHDSIAMNVALGDPSVSRDDIERTLKEAHAWEFVSRMPDGIDTRVGERGSALSGGQRQRIAIARALVHAPRLLVLDEATAALDRESERAIWEVVAGFRGRMTILAISHQQALLDVADVVYRLEDGAVTRVEADAAPGTGATAGTRGAV